MKIILTKIALSLLLVAGFTSVFAQDKVFVMEIRGDIDPSMSRYMEMALQEATDIKADYIIIDMDTYGGAVNDADKIRGMILDHETPIYVFINKNAASAGALISVACDSIYMQKGSNIGAATVVSGGSGDKADEKYQSYMRSMMRSTAEAKGRNPKIAEAMVDESIGIEGVIAEGKLISFNVSEAIANGFCEGMMESIEDILIKNNITDYELIKYELTTTEKIIAFFLSPGISAILILIMLGGIYFELQTPGVGFPIAAALLAAILYFTPYYLNGLAEHWEILAFLIGIGLIMAELFVIPGFGIAGISGIIITFGALVFAMLDNEFFDFTYVDGQAIQNALIATLGGALGSIIVIFFGVARLSQSEVFKKVSLQDSFHKEDGYTSKFSDKNFVGLTGTAYTVLRPSGKIMIDEEIYDASTRGDYINKGDEVVVVSDEGSSLRVKKVGVANN